MDKNVKEKIKIDSEFCFNPDLNFNLKNEKDIINKLNINYEAIAGIEGGNEPIFIDANIILEYYSSSISEKNKVMSFLKKYEKRIRLTNHNQKEILKNREKKIGDYISKVEKLKKSISEYKQIIIEKLSLEYQEIIQKDYKTLLKSDFPNTLKYLEEGKRALQKVIDENFPEEDFKKALNEVELKDLSMYKTNMFYDDEILLYLRNIPIEEELGFDEISFIEKLANKLKENKEIFPGLKDLKKLENKIGDFITFHELLKHVKKTQQDVIYLTNDTKKGDWIQENGKQIILFYRIVYHLTGHYIFIVDAAKFFDLSNIMVTNQTFGTISERTKKILEKIPKDGNGIFKFEHGNLSNSDLSYANLLNSKFHKINLSNCTLCEVDFTNSDLSEADLKGSDLTNVNFTNSNLSGSDLSNTYEGDIF
jgi:hypothetical protein